MMRSVLTAAGVLLTAAVGTAADPAQHLGTYKAGDADTQDIGGYRYRGWYGGYRGFSPGFYGGFGYRGFYTGYRGFNPGYYGGFHGYRPGFAFNYYSVPNYYYAPPVFGYSSYYYGGWAPISDRPAVSLRVNIGRPTAVNPVTPPMPPAAPAADSTFRYDGGPTAPVPMPPVDAEPPAVRPGLPEPKSDTLHIAMTKRTAKPVNRYPAYGEKR